MSSEQNNPVDISYPAAMSVGSDLIAPFDTSIDPSLLRVGTLLVAGTTESATLATVKAVRPGQATLHCVADVVTHRSLRHRGDQPFQWTDAPGPMPRITTEQRFFDPDVRGVTVMARGLGRLAFLAELPNLDTLHLYHPTAEQLGDISAIPRLRRLFLYASATKLLDPLAQLHDLRELSLNSATKVTSLEPLASLASLRTLRLDHFPRITSIDALARLPGLTALNLSVITSSTSAHLIDSLRPLRDLAALTHLAMLGVVARDRSLAPLHQLANLCEVSIPNYYSRAEVAALLVNQPNLQGFGVQPALTFNRCMKCKTGRTVQLIGGRPRQACTWCTPKLILRHIAAFEHDLATERAATT